MLLTDDTQHCVLIDFGIAAYGHELDSDLDTRATAHVTRKPSGGFHKAQMVCASVPDVVGMCGVGIVQVHVDRKCWRMCAIPVHNTTQPSDNHVCQPATYTQHMRHPLYPSFNIPLYPSVSLCIPLYPSVSPQVGTLEYMAPEVLQKRPHSQHSDVYALATTVNELATGVVPFSDCTRDNPKAHTILEMGYGRYGG